ncbi:MAG: response regulator transcription factor, partial [Chloroflexi bacterium]|nr:response regulator transcription factor [Chloroflexota bacterium]
VLTVDDDIQTLRYVRNALVEAGYTSFGTGDPAEADRLLSAEEPDLVLLGAIMPRTDGFALINRIAENTDAPVIFLSERDQDQDIAKAFEMGAADYIVKPFSANELVARIRVALRGQSAQAKDEHEESYLLRDLRINFAERRVTVDGRPIKLTATEYDLLTELSNNAGRVLTHDHLLQRVWGPTYEGDSQLLRTYVKYLRQKLGDDASNPKYIFTEPRVGYRMARS